LKRNRIPGVVDLYELRDPEEIKAAAGTAVIDRQFDTKTCPFNWFLLQRSLRALSYRGKRFPTMMPRNSAPRKADQDALWTRLNLMVPELRKGPENLEPLALWVRDDGHEEVVGPKAQQILGRLFSNDFVATPESWDAALILVRAPRLTNIATLLWWTVSGKITRAKQRLAGMVGNDLSAVNAIGIAVHNLVKSLRTMRKLYSDAAVRRTLSPAEAAQRCLAAPVSLYRQATADGELRGCHFSKNSLFVLYIGEAATADGAADLVFMRDSWSSCPAEQWVPAMLEGVWTRAIATDTASPTK
jgi:hypothetical protein